MISEWRNKVIQGDCLELMKKLPNNSIDLIVTDPPYNIGIDEWDKIDNFLVWMKDIIKELVRITKKNGSIYIFGDFKFIGDIKVLFNDEDVSLNSWIIWDKGSKAQNSTRSYVNIIEHCLYFIKGIGKDMNIPTELNTVRNYLRDQKQKSSLSNKEFNLLFSDFYNKEGCRDRSVIEHYFSEKQWCFPSEEIYRLILQKTGFFDKDYDELKIEYKNLTYTFNHESIRIKRNPRDKRKFNYDKQLLPNVWYFNNKVEMTQFKHPTVKPIELIKTMVKASSNIGGLVLDPFLGSGTTAVACKQLGRDFIGMELSEEYVEIARKRLEQKHVRDWLK